MQQPVAQLGEVSETFSAIYHCEIEQIELCGFYSIKCAQNLSFLALSQQPLGNKKGCKSVYAIYTLLGGERGIRTPGALPHNGFQDRRIRPLCHFSKRKGTTKIRFGKGERLRKRGKTPFGKLATRTDITLLLAQFLSVRESITYR